MIPTQLRAAFLVAVSLAFAACGGDGLTLPDEGEAAHIEVMNGSGQTGRVGTALDDSLEVLVTDTRDKAVANATVLFSFSSPAAGSASPASVSTNADGIARAKLTLGSTTGDITGKAEVSVPAGVTPVETSFTATALPADANGISLVSGQDQTAPVSTTLAESLVVVVTDGFGNPISGISVSWNPTGGGTVSGTSTVTGADGRTAVTRTLGATAGPQTTEATAEGLVGSPVVFNHTATAGSATGVVKVSGDNQSAEAGTQLANPLVVRVLDSEGNPIPGRAVTWVVSDGTPSETNTTTDGAGETSITWTLGATPGDKTANAVVSGVGTATFNATATAGSTSATTSTVTANPETITAGVTSSTITVTVRDAASNPVAGVAVSIESSGTGNTITPASANTEGDGVARFTFSSTVAEEKTITATAGGVTITDQAIVTVQKAASVTRITRDEPDRSTVGDVVTVEYRVTGPGGTPTGTVTITASGGNETCSASVEAGQCDIKLDAQGNPRVLTATYSGDARFNGSTDTENHRVDAPVPNNPPTAAFEVHCEDNSLTCDFTSNSHDTDGQLVAFSWDFGDPASGANNTSTLQFPSHDYSAPGSYTVTLTVTDNDQATDSETRTFTVTGPPANTAPIAVNDEYSRSLFGGALVVPADQGVLANDTDDNGPLTAKNASDPANGSVALNPDGSFTYTPDGLSLSPDTFTYEVTDGELTSTATVTINTTP